MPARPSHHNNARNNKEKSKIQSPRPSPPTQLPTPLPEEDRVATTPSATLEVPPDDRLIDFDTPTPPPQRFPPPESTLDIDPLQLEYEEDDILAHTYRSPPFREAHLPDIEPDQDHSPPPLPIPPRGSTYQQEESYDDYGGDVDNSVTSSSGGGGHTRWPTYSRSNTSRNSSIPPFITPSTSTRSPSRHSPLPYTSPHPSTSQTPSTFHSLTRTLRSYVPSSIHIPIPSAAPSPPLVSRPVSFGRFSSDSRMDANSGLGLGLTGKDAVRGRKLVSRQEFERDYEQEGEEYYAYARDGYGYGHGYGQAQRSPSEPVASGLARTIIQNRTAASVANSSTGDAFDKSSEDMGGMDAIEWAKWDVLGDRRFLILAYPAGLQIWDCSDLGAISEILNLNFNSEEWGMVLGNGRGGSTKRQEEGMVVRVIHAALLPVRSEAEAHSGMRDTFGRDRPLLGILMQLDNIEDDYQEECDSSFILYSLRNHQIVKRIALSGSPATFIANDQFIIISIASPPSLFILSSTTFQTLHIVPSTSLELFSPLPHHSTSSTTSGSQPSPPQSPIISNKSVPSSRLSINSRDNSSGNHRRHDSHPVFALSHRLLAYASPSPSSSTSPPSSKANNRLSSSSLGSNPNSSLSSSPSPFGLGGLNIGKVTNMTQADLGQAALKVGESVLGGMKFLGGMAYGAARSRVSGGGDVGRVNRGREGLGSGARFVSRSAPDTPPVGDGQRDEAAAQRLRERRLSNTSSVSGYHLTTVAPSTKSSTTASNGYYITIVDLSPLLISAVVSGKKSTDTTTLVKNDEFMSSRSQPIADLLFSADGTSLAVIQRDGYVVKTFKLRPSASVQVYTLRRGRTSAVVEGSDWSKDGRWLAIGTRKRTVHVFPVNPYGGKPDIASHLEGKVRNVDVFQHPLTELSPLIRLRGQSSASDHPNAPLAFTFISPLDISQSPRLLPQQHIPKSSSPTISPHHLSQFKQQQDFQDVLLFDPVDGVLSLRRLSLDKQFTRDQGLGMAAAAASVQALGVTSISLPGMGSAGTLARSPSRSRGNGNKPSSSVMDPPAMELVAKESTVATWHLQRRTDWVEIKQSMVNPEIKLPAKRLGGDWLAEAELTTCSNSQHVLPRSIYLSHQFSFHTLGEDYHALIRRHQFDISGEEIKVRKQVEISAYSSSGQGNNNTSAAFIEGFSAPRDIRRISSSFDEPIASAISGSFDNSNLPAILPMYPNGIPGAKPKSFRNSIPIRTMAGIGDGVSEGLGRIRREMNKVRSPVLLPRSDSSIPGPVPLEFEEDEDFVARDVEDDDGYGDGLQVPTTIRHRDEASSTSRGTSREGRTSADSTSSLGLETPANTSIHHHHHLPLVDDSDVVGTVDEEIWNLNGWDQQDASAIDEAEQFDNISAVGYLDEEQARPTPAAVTPVVLNSKRKGRGRRN